MLTLVSIDYKQFKHEIYSYYVKLFPKTERKSLRNIKRNYLKGITKLIKIMDDDIVVGFLIYHTLDQNPYILLEYFGIFQEFQNQQYGSKTVKILKTFFKNYKGIYGEVEKIGLGKDEIENKIREKRIRFWKNLGFEFLDIDLKMFHVIYSPCILKIKDTELDCDEIMKYAFEFYDALLGEKRVRKNCMIMKDSELQ